jgi:hypothetical protein
MRRLALCAALSGALATLAAADAAGAAASPAAFGGSAQQQAQQQAQQEQEQEQQQQRRLRLRRQQQARAARAARRPYSGPLLTGGLGAADGMGDATLECGLREAAWRFAPALPRDPRDLYDALMLGPLCGLGLQQALAQRGGGAAAGAGAGAGAGSGAGAEAGTAPLAGVASAGGTVSLTSEPLPAASSGAECVELFVANSEHPGSPGWFASVHDAVEASRLVRGQCKRVNLAPGVTYLNSTLRLDARDSGLVLRGDGASSWLSGGVPIHVAGGALVLAAGDLSVSAELQVQVSADVGEVEALFLKDPHVRFQRARWPNGNSETDQWGYASPLSGTVSVDAARVREWVKPAPFQPAAFSYVDLRREGNPTGYLKADSGQEEYNQYTSGRGGACDALWDTSFGGSGSYWCGNASSGGWAEVDQEFAKGGTWGLPAGLAYYGGNDTVGRRVASWGQRAGGAVVHAWHSQSWFTNMFEVSAHDEARRVLRFGRGGSQGGRSWCRCDQCSYAAAWCRKDGDGDVDGDDDASDTRGTPDTRLISGTWYVENVEAELDAPGEFFFRRGDGLLRLLLNTSAAWAFEPAGEGNVTTGAPPQPRRSKPLTLVVPRLATLVAVEGGAEAVSIEGLGFRDSRATFMERHGVPSGGDWSLYRGAALELSNTTRTAVRGCRFERLDGTALLLAGRSRGVTVSRCEFAWLGESAMAAWGETEQWDGRAGDQPRGVLLENNVVREIGIYQKQSSAWFQAKACNVTLRGNTFFNLPRAAVNFNDGFGGGNEVTGNLLFNTCRESGDHGAINSWDRQPFLWDTSGRYAFDTPPTRIHRNLILANYGASQGVDSDDGSSFYHVQDNVFWGDGAKMDYGGHDSLFTHNLILVRPYDGQNCYNMWTFKPGHAHRFTDNVCAVLGCRGDCQELVGAFAGCADGDGPITARNTYYTAASNASLQCSDQRHTIGEMQRKYGLEAGSTWHALPEPNLMVQWVNDKITGWVAPRQTTSAPSSSTVEQQQTMSR